MKKPTLRDLARELGLGKSTVQRALANAPEVGPATVQRVREMADRMGYQRDAYFAALSEHRSRSTTEKLILFYLYGKRQSGGGSIGLGLQDHLRQLPDTLGYTIEGVDCNDYPQPEQLPEILYNRGASGLFLGPVPPSMFAALRAETRIPLLCCHAQEELPFHTVCFDVAEIMSLCWQKLWEAGYRRIGIAPLSHNELLRDDLLRHSLALGLLHTHLEPSEHIPPLTAHIGDEPAYRNWLLEYRPEAVIGFRIWYAQVTHEVLGKNVPFVTLNSFLVGNLSWVAGAYSDPAVLAMNALMQMDNLIRHSHCGMPEQAVTHNIMPVWYPGEGILSPT